MPTGVVQVGTALLLWRNSHEFLVGQRLGSHSAGEWWLPGGKPDPGERPVDCALRETHEETGIPIEAMRFPRSLRIWTYDTHGDWDRHFVCVYFAAYLNGRYDPRIMEPDKCSEWRWVDSLSIPEPHHPDIHRIVEESSHA